MKFKSRVDLFFKVIIYSVCGLLVFVFFQELTINKVSSDTYTIAIILASVIVLLLSILFRTNYELTEEYLIYRTSFFKGKIKVESINEIIIGKTLWVGLRVATARNGLIIKFGKHKEIYLSPASNEAFVKQLLKLNPTIKLTR